MTELKASELVRAARQVLGWDELNWGDMFGVEDSEVKAWESDSVEIDELVLTISAFVLECQVRADLLHEIFDVPSLDEDGVLTLLGFLRDAIQSGEVEGEDLTECLFKAIEMVVDLASLHRDEDSPTDNHENESPIQNTWDV